MHVTVDRLEEDEESRTVTPTERLRERLRRCRRRRIDVSDLDARSVQQYARDRVGTDRVSLEHRGARTYLVVEEDAGEPLEG